MSEIVFSSFCFLYPFCLLLLLLLPFKSITTNKTSNSQQHYEHIRFLTYLIMTLNICQTKVGRICAPCEDKSILTTFSSNLFSFFVSFYDLPVYLHPTIACLICYLRGKRAKIRSTFIFSFDVYFILFLLCDYLITICKVWK